MARQVHDLSLMDLDGALESGAGELSLFLSESPRVMKLNLLTLPQFNVSIIIRFLSVTERLTTMTAVHPRFRDFVYRPQCFPDLSFTLDDGGQTHAPQIRSANLNNGITYVEINVDSNHPFVCNVAFTAGMWNLKAETWVKTKWPAVMNVDSLQLELGALTNIKSLQLDRRWTKAVDDLKTKRNQQMRIDDDDNDDRRKEESDCGREELEVASASSSSLVIDDPNASVLRNLFFIKMEHSEVTPCIEFPRTLLGLGLQKFNSSLFGMAWWHRQVLVEQRLFSLRFLVLSGCELLGDEMAVLLSACRNVEHLSLRYTSWEGSVVMPSSLRSLAFFPQKHFHGGYDVMGCSQLWQICTRLNEDDAATVQFLNACSKVPSIKRVRFEFIRRPQFTEEPLRLSALQQWDRANDADFELAVCEEDLEEYPQLRKAFAVQSERNIVGEDRVHFADCPFWSERSKEFITMAKNRKLLVR